MDREWKISKYTSELTRSTLCRRGSERSGKWGEAEFKEGGAIWIKKKNEEQEDQVKFPFVISHGFEATCLFSLTVISRSPVVVVCFSSCPRSQNNVVLHLIFPRKYHKVIRIKTYIILVTQPFLWSSPSAPHFLFRVNPVVASYSWTSNLNVNILQQIPNNING